MNQPPGSPALTPEAKKQMAIPICPHCTKELPSLGMFNWAMGVLLIGCLFCPECKKPLHFETGQMPEGKSSIIS